MSSLGYRQRRGGMGRAGRLRKTKTVIRPTYTLKIGRVKEITHGGIIIESFCGKLISLTQKCALGPVAKDDVVKITQDAPGYLTGTTVTKVERNIFGTVESVGNEYVSIVVDMFQDNRRILTINKEVYENYLRPILHQKIKLYINEKKHLCIAPV